MPPAVLMQEVPVPRLTGTTNKDLLDFALGAEAAALKLNYNMGCLREWYARERDK